MNNSQVAHAWAAQRKESGKGSSFYFYGPTIYSYGRHFPIATFTDHTAKDGRRIVLFTVRGYSNTTAKHISLARGALYGLGVRVIECRDVDGHASHNLQDMQERYNTLLLKASRARTNGESYLREAVDIADMARDYCAAYSLQYPEFPEPDAATLATMQERARKEADARKAQAKERERLRALDYAEKIAEFRAGADTSTLALWQTTGEATALRLSRDGKHVETSRGAAITIRTARRLFAEIARSVGTSDEYRAAIVTAARDVDGFTLREVRADGSIVVGCHTLEWPEISAFAAAREW